MKKLFVAAAIVLGSIVAVPSLAGASPAPADGRCVAQGAGFTFDGPTKSVAARGGLGLPMQTIILDHVFNSARTVEGALNTTICS